jgi:hypothetical protein
MADINKLRSLIGEFIDEMGGDSYEQRIDKNLWLFPHGSVVMSIFLLEDEEDPDDGMIVCGTRVMKVPLKMALPFYRKLLEANYQMLGRCSFSIDAENVVHLQASRLIEDLDYSELRDIIHIVSGYSDRYDDILLDEFGRENEI